MKYIVINMDRSADRMSFMHSQLLSSGMDYVRFPAISNASPDHDRLLNSKKFRRLFGRDISKGELGCFRSHIQCLKEFISGDDRSIVILEDDVQLSDGISDLIENLSNTLDNTFEDWQCVNLSSSYDKRFTTAATINGLMLRKAWQFPILTSALMWSRAGAELFLSNVEKNGIYAPVDNQLRYVLSRSGKGFSFDRPPISLASFESTIGVVNGEAALTQPVTEQKSKKNSIRDIAKRAPLYGWSILNHAKYYAGSLVNRYSPR